MIALLSLISAAAVVGALNDVKNIVTLGVELRGALVFVLGVSLGIVSSFLLYCFIRKKMLSRACDMLFGFVSFLVVMLLVATWQYMPRSWLIPTTYVIMHGLVILYTYINVSHYKRFLDATKL
jgi:hypothetical protein